MATTTTHPLTPSERLMQLAYTETDLTTVLHDMADRFCVIIVRPSGVAGKITLSSKEPESVQEAIDRLNKGLEPLGYAAFMVQPRPADHAVVRIGLLAAVEKAVSLVVQIGSDPEKIEISDRLITQIVPVKSIDAFRLRMALDLLIDPGAEVSVNSNMIVIADTSAHVHRLVEVIAVLDEIAGRLQAR